MPLSTASRAKLTKDEAHEIASELTERQDLKNVHVVISDGARYVKAEFEYEDLRGDVFVTEKA